MKLFKTYISFTCGKEDQEVNLAEEFELALNFGDIESQTYMLRKAVLDLSILEKKEAILNILNRSFEDEFFGGIRDRGYLRSKSGEYVFSWEFEIKE